jgi:hypothetical protein
MYACTCTMSGVYTRATIKHWSIPPRKRRRSKYPSHKPFYRTTVQVLNPPSNFTITSTPYSTSISTGNARKARWCPETDEETHESLFPNVDCLYVYDKYEGRRKKEMIGVNFIVSLERLILSNIIIRARRTYSLYKTYPDAKETPPLASSRLLAELQSRLRPPSDFHRSKLLAYGSHSPPPWKSRWTNKSRYQGRWHPESEK